MNWLDDIVTQLIIAAARGSFVVTRDHDFIVRPTIPKAVKNIIVEVAFMTERGIGKEARQHFSIQ